MLDARKQVTLSDTIAAHNEVGQPLDNVQSDKMYKYGLDLTVRFSVVVGVRRLSCVVCHAA